MSFFDFALIVANIYFAKTMSDRAALMMGSVWLFAGLIERVIA